MDDALLHLRLKSWHLLVTELGVGARDLRHAIHHLHLLHLDSLLVDNGEGHLLRHLLRLDGASPDLLVDHLDRRFGSLRGEFHVDNVGHLHRRLHLEVEGLLNELLEVAVLLLCKRLIDVLDDGLRNLPNHLADLNLRHLYDPFLVDDVRDLHDLLHILHLDLGDLFLYVLHFDLWHLPDHLADFYLRHLHNLLLDLYHEHLLHILHKLEDLLLDCLINLLQVHGPWDLLDKFDGLSYDHLLDLLAHGDLRHLHMLLLDLDDRLLHLNNLALAQLLWHLLQQVYDLHLGHLSDHLLVDNVRNLDHPLARLVHGHGYLLNRLLVFHPRLLPNGLVLLDHLLHRDLLVYHLMDNLLLLVLQLYLRDLHDLLNLLNLVDVLDDRVLLHDMLSRHILENLLHDGSDDVLVHRLHHGRLLRGLHGGLLLLRLRHRPYAVAASRVLRELGRPP
mmetsp:Transcript_73378/g.157211  ORF Transcript_73378/g.157211 Transcript_73378/m.157211 type:complete len:447 (+) Transcript_73378:1014-2354(+)